MRSLTRTPRYRKMFLFPRASKIVRAVPPADGSCNVSVIAPDVLENEALGSVVSALAAWSPPDGFKGLLNVQVSRGETRGPSC